MGEFTLANATLAERAKRDPLKITLITGASLGNDLDKTLAELASKSGVRPVRYTGDQFVYRTMLDRDDIEPGDTRGYLFGNALIELPRDYQLGIQVQVASDRSYLLDYDITEADRRDALRDRGLAYLQLEYLAGARHDLGQYLKRNPEASDAQWLREKLIDLGGPVPRLH